MAVVRHLGFCRTVSKTTLSGAFIVASVTLNFILISLMVVKIMQFQFFIRLA